MMRNMVTSLIEHGRIVTTVQKAKELRRLADKMVTLGKRGNLHARRQALSVVRSRAAVARLFEEIAPKLGHRKGGYTRVVRIGPRRGDGAELSLVEFALEPLEEKGGKEKPKAAAPETGADGLIPQAAPEAPKVQEAPPEEEGTTAGGAHEGESQPQAADADQASAGAEEAQGEGGSPAQEPQVQPEAAESQPQEGAAADEAPEEEHQEAQDAPPEATGPEASAEQEADAQAQTQEGGAAASPEGAAPRPKEGDA